MTDYIYTRDYWNQNKGCILSLILEIIYNIKQSTVGLHDYRLRGMEVYSMANMIDYIKWRGDLSFSVSPFNEVDSLIFTQLMYLDFRGIVGGIKAKQPVSMEEAGRKYFQRNSRRMIERLPLVARDSADIFREMMKSERFQGCQLSQYVQEVNHKEEYQFSAMKIVIPDQSCYLAFGGTDNSLAGWKENFNMSYLEFTPGQRKAVEYVEQILSASCRQVRLGGHSKGGNLAIYAAIKSKNLVQNRLLEVYNFDGPGFTADMVTIEEYRKILSKIKTRIPESSVIGMLFEHEEDFEIVRSTEKGIMQHRAISWVVEGVGLVRMKALSENSILWEGAFRSWLASLKGMERQQFVNSMFMVLVKAGITDTDELKKMNLRRLVTLLHAVDNLKNEERSAIYHAVKKLVCELDKAREAN